MLKFYFLRQFFLYSHDGFRNNPCQRITARYILFRQSQSTRDKGLLQSALCVLLSSGEIVREQYRRLVRKYLVFRSYNNPFFSFFCKCLGKMWTWVVAAHFKPLAFSKRIKAMRWRFVHLCLLKSQNEALTFFRPSPRFLNLQFGFL